MLFCNETKITNESLRLTELIEKLFCCKSVTTMQLLICTFIIIGTMFLKDEQLLHKIIYIIIGIIGFIDIFKIDKPDNRDILLFNYQFFDEYFLLNIEGHDELKFYYCDLEHLIDMKGYYFLVYSNAAATIDKEGFSIGNKEEMKKFILEKRKKQA